MTGGLPTVNVAGTPVHLLGQREAVSLISGAARRPGRRPLAVASINLDHIHHFGRQSFSRTSGGDVEWLNLIDGAPIARHAARRRKQVVPKLSGSDLIEPILEEASAHRLSVGLIGGAPHTVEPFASAVRERWPGVRIAGHWTPPREVLTDPEQSAAIASKVHDAQVDILLVCLGKPRQEEWIRAHGAASGARVLLAFGAVVDFVAGGARRAPAWASRAGLEWAWRLAREPRRLARRYLVHGPPAYLRLRRSK